MARLVASSFKYRWVILGVCWLAYIVVFMERLSIPPLAPFLKEDLALTSAQVGFFMSAAAGGYAIMLIPAGWLVDRIGVRRMLLIGEVTGGIFITGMVTINSFAGGIVFMALAGLGMGCLMPSTTKAVLEWFPMKERATAMGLKQTAVNVGGIITASTLPTIALTLGWRYGFVMYGFVGIVIGIVSFMLYREPPQSVALDNSEPVIPSGPRPSVGEVIKSREIPLLIGAGFCMIVVEFSGLTHFVLYLKDALLLPVVTAGFFLAFVEGGGAFGKPISGLISDRLFHGGRKRVYMMWTGVAFAMCLIFTFLGEGSPLWLIIPTCLIFGFVGIGWGGLQLTLVGEFAGKEVAGVVTGISTALLLIGNIVGPPSLGHLIDVTGSYQIAWQVLAALALVATVLLLFVREERRRI
jgi:ACS family hexuronate transporter-like MFS transporter